MEDMGFCASFPRMITDAPSPIVAILGAGPAGMSCANVCLSFGLAPLVIERGDHVGGAQRTNFHENLWLLGAPGETGETMTRRLAQHYASLPVTTHLRAELERVARDARGFQLDLNLAEGTRRLRAAALVLATGMRPRATAELAALAARSERIIIGPLSDAIRDRIRDASVLILGGGDNALDHALFLAKRGNRVQVAARAALSARAAFIAACANRENIELRARTAPLRLVPRQAGIQASWPDRDDSLHDWLLVMFGYLPNTDVLRDFDEALRPTLTPGGHVHVDGWQRTDVAGLYAAGDITDSPQPSVPTAIAQGLVAARAVERDLAAKRTQ